MVVNPEEQQQPAEQDLAMAAADGWPHREFPAAEGRQGRSVPVVIKQSILNAIRRHGQQYPDVEVCGVLVGHGYRDQEGPFVYSEGSIRGDHSGSRAAQVTFTGETWNHIYEVLDKAWPDKRILGWYHTHPGFGVFLSGMDLFIQENFFSAPEQVALVYDPLSGDEGLFVWRAGEPVKSGFPVEKDAGEDPPQRPAATKAQIAAAETVGDLFDGNNGLRQRVERLLRRQKIIAATLAGLWLVAIFWSVVGAILLLTERGFDTKATPPPDIREERPSSAAEADKPEQSPRPQGGRPTTRNASEQVTTTPQDSTGGPPAHNDTPEGSQRGGTQKPEAPGP